MAMQRRLFARQPRRTAADPVPESAAGEQAFFTVGLDGRIGAWSSPMARLLGRQAEGLLDSPARKLVAADAQAAWDHAVAHVQAGECIKGVSLALKDAHGKAVPLTLDLYPARSETGRLVGVTAACGETNGAAPVRPLPVEGRGTWTRAIVETAVDGVITFDLSGRIEYCNPAAERMFGYEAAEVTGKDIGLLLPLRLDQAHGHYLEDGASADAGAVREVTGTRKDGSEIPVEYSLSEVMLDERRVFTLILHDITNRRRRQEELNKRNIELTCLYRVGEAIRSHELLSDVFQQVVRLVTPAFKYPEITRCRITFDGDRYVSSPFSATPRRLAADIAVEGRKRGELEVFYMEPRPDIEYGPFLREERELIDAVANALNANIERREADAKVIQASKLASIGELAAGVGHEINNPLNGIMNCADLLSEQFEDGSKGRQFADLVRSEAERIATIVRNLLTFARQEREHHSPARLCDIVEVVLSLTRKKLAKSHVHLEVDVPEDLPKVRCRSEQLQQVVMNLIINAMHALDERFSGTNPDKILRLAAEPVTEGGERYLRLTIEDHGCGIAPSHMARLFDPFFTTKGRDVGTGLGLSISNGIVRDHGGQIRVESEEGRYARFHVELPLE